jgi:transcription initiation factor TFIIB
LTVFDPETGEIVCSKCGMVIRDNIESLEPEWTTYKCKDLDSKLRGGMLTSLAIHDRGLSTLISYSNIDANGHGIDPEQINNVNRLRRWNKIANCNNNNRGYVKNLRHAFTTMSRIGDKFSLPDSVTENAAHFYRKAIHKRLIKGRSIEAVVVACVYAACRQHNIPRTLDELAAAVNANEVFAGKCYRLIVRELNIKYLYLADPNTYLSRIANDAKVGEKTYRRALEMLAKMTENHISIGKNPKALAVAVLYAACQTECDGARTITQRYIALVGDTSIVTLRKRSADIQKVLLV